MEIHDSRIMDLHNSIMEIHNSIMETHNSIMNIFGRKYLFFVYMFYCIEQHLLGTTVQKLFF